MPKIKDNINLKQLEKYGFDYGEDFLYEIYHIRELKNGSWSLVVDENSREIFIYSYKFSNNEESLETKIIKDIKTINRYAKNIINRLIDNNLIEEYVMIPKGQARFNEKGNIEILKSNLYVKV